MQVICTTYLSDKGMSSSESTGLLTATVFELSLLSYKSQTPSHHVMAMNISNVTRHLSNIRYIVKCKTIHII